MAEGITTFYKGVEYRSRLEARWACFFDLIGWKFEYEPFDLDYYIPDFLLVGQHPTLVEVKPYASLDEFKPLAANLPKAPYPFLLVGSTPFNRSEYWDEPTIGLVSERATGQDDAWFGCAGLARCYSCRSYYFVHQDGSWIPRGVEDPCGECRKPHLALDDEAVARGLWAQAQNLTKWAA